MVTCKCHYVDVTKCIIFLFLYYVMWRYMMCGMSRIINCLKIVVMDIPNNNRVTVNSVTHAVMMMKSAAVSVDDHDISIYMLLNFVSLFLAQMTLCLYFKSKLMP